MVARDSNLPWPGESACNAQHRRIGTWVIDANGVLVLDKGTLDPARHIWKAAQAWGTDVDLIARMRPDDGVRFSVPDGTVYWATRDSHEQRGFKKDFGYGEQWFLPDKVWEKQPRLLHELPAPALPQLVTPELAPPAPPLDSALALARPSSMIQAITPELAQRWLVDYRYPHQRPLHTPNVRKIARAIQRCEFPLTTIKLVHFEGQDYLVNGQHRLSAIVMAGQTIEINVVHETVASQEALAQVYATEDIGRGRTFADSFHAYDLQAELGFAQERHVRALSAAVVYFVNEFRAHVGDDAQLRGVRLQQMRDWAAEAREAYEIVNGVSGTFQRRLMSAGILSVMLVTLRYQPGKARAFWYRVAHGIDLQAKSPEHTLHRYINDHEATGRTRAPLYSRVIAAAWNAYFEERPSLQIIRPSDPSTAIVIKGTPYTGKTHAA